MCQGVAVNDHAGVDQILRIDALFERFHDLIDLATPFGFHERSHIPSGSMFGFKGSVVLFNHHGHYIFDKSPVSFCFFRCIKRLGNYEMKISIFGMRSEEHTSELQSLMRTSYAVSCLTKTTNTTNKPQ